MVKDYNSDFFFIGFFKADYWTWVGDN